MGMFYSFNRVSNQQQPQRQHQRSSTAGHMPCVFAYHAAPYACSVHSTLWSSQISHNCHYHTTEHVDNVVTPAFSSPTRQQPLCRLCTYVHAAKDNDSVGLGPDSNSSSPSRAGDADPASSSSSNSTSNDEAWALMGRVVSSDRLVIGQSSRQRLVLIAAAKQAGITLEEMAERLKELVLLLPDLASQLPSLHPKTLAVLAADTAGVAQKLIWLRLLFPSADVSQMISRRPTLLLDEEFEQVSEARDKLLARMAPTANTAAPHASSKAAAQANLLGTTGPAGSSSSSSSTGGSTVLGSGGGAGTAAVLDGLVSRQPLLLVRDVDALLDELERLMPGTEILSLLQHNPDMIYMVQRGTAQLGPGAEFMAPY